MSKLLGSARDVVEIEDVWRPGCSVLDTRYRVRGSLSVPVRHPRMFITLSQAVGRCHNGLTRGLERFAPLPQTSPDVVYSLSSSDKECNHERLKPNGPGPELGTFSPALCISSNQLCAPSASRLCPCLGSQLGLCNGSCSCSCNEFLRP